MLKHQLQNKKKAKYKMSNFCEQNSSFPIAPSRKKGKKHDKSHAKEKIVSEKYDKQPSKNKFNMLNIDNKD